MGITNIPGKNNIALLIRGKVMNATNIGEIRILWH